MATNTSDFYTYSKTAGTAKNLQKPTDGGDNNLWGGYINVDLDTIVGAVNATSDLIADANQNELVDFTATGSAVNHVGITNAATGDGPTIEAKGDDSNVDLNVKPKGTGAILIKDGDGNELVKTSRTASAVNEITVANAATGNGPTLSATGDDTNIDLNITPKGTGDSVFSNKIKVDDVIEKTTDHGVEIDGVTLKDSGGTFGASVDLQGNELILDADNDTSITADTDDQIDFKTGGSDRLVINSGGDVYSEPATTITWTVSGISSLTQDSNFYKRIGKMVFISGRLFGPGNSTSFSVTNLPYAGKSACFQSIAVGGGRDNGTFISSITALVNGSTLTFYKNSVSTFGSGTGDRRAYFSGWYEAETI
jgi:hypothetical protein